MHVKKCYGTKKILRNSLNMLFPELFCDRTQLEKIIPKEKILQNVQMKKYTSFKIGGEAEVLIKISTLEELTKIIKYIKQKNIQTFMLYHYLFSYILN